jgi:hypothetical protein
VSQSPIDAETTTLLRYLNAQRRHVVGILEGLDDDALRRPVLPSGWSCLGLIQHLALDVERFWFGAVVAGDPTVITSLDDIENAWQVNADVPATDIFNLYQQEIDRANAIITARSPETPPAWWPADLFGDFRLHTLREIILHVMTETASHAGHLDAARELIDRRQWMVLTG